MPPGLRLRGSTLAGNSGSRPPGVPRWPGGRRATRRGWPIAALCAAACGGRAASPPDAPIAITHATLIDGTGAAPRADVTIIVRGRHVVAVGPSAAVPLPRGARVLDATGKFVIPGLWDMHVHAFGHSFPTFAGPLFVAFGVTGARDMGYYVDTARHWRREVAAGRTLGPRLVIGGRLDGPENRAPWVSRAATADDARRAVDTLVRGGVDFIKVYSRLPRAAYFAAADQARRRGVPIAGHVPYEVSVVEAADAGQRSVEHEDDLMRACGREDARLRRELAAAPANAPPAAQLALVRDHARRIRAGYDAGRCAAVIARLAGAGTWLTPTLVVYQPYARSFDTAATHPAFERYVPRGLRAEWRQRVRGTTAADTSVVAAYFDLARTDAFRRAGGRLLAGTDSPLPYAYPGLAIHDELALLVRAGLRPAEALEAATRGPAAYLGALDSLGTVATGKVADLVVLDADPLAEITNTRRVHAVVANGRLLDSAARAALLRRVEAAAR